jgi:trimeric autotransporter adhesin
MAAIANRELSQFAAFLDVDGANTGTPSNIGIATNTTVNVGIGTSIASSKLTIQGNVQVSGALTATSTLNSPIIVAPTAYINTGIVTNVTSQYLNVTGVATIANISISAGIISSITATTGTVDTLFSVVGVVTSLAGTGLTYTNGTFTNLYATNGYINVGVVTSLAGTGLTYTSGTFTNLYATNGYINTGIVTTISGTNASYSTINNTDLYSNNGYINVGIVTTISGSYATYTGANITNLSGTIGTVTTLNGTNSTLDNLSGTGVTYTTGKFGSLFGTNGFINSGIVTTISGTNLSYSGISTIGGVQFSTTGIITAAQGIAVVTYYGDGSNLANISASSFAQRDSVLPLLNPTGILSTFNFVNTNGGTTWSAGFLSVDVGKAASGPTNAIQFKNASGIFSGSSNFTWNGSTVAITGDCSATNFNSTSDINLKENIITFDNALNIVSELRGVKFDWKESHSPSIGVIAQELEEVLPELVTTTDIKQVNYNGIIGVLIEAIKELKTEVETLKNQINNQQGGL